METIKVTEIKFGSFVKLIGLTALPIGIFFGIIMFVLSLLGGDVKTNLGPYVLEGVAGGIAGLVVGPLVFLIFGLIVGVLAYLPVKITLKIFKGIFLRLKFDRFVSNDDLPRDE